jgi:hypothetical protein
VWSSATSSSRARCIVSENLRKLTLSTVAASSRLALLHTDDSSSGNRSLGPVVKENSTKQHLLQGQQRKKGGPESTSKPVSVNEDQVGSELQGVEKKGRERHRN